MFCFCIAILTLALLLCVNGGGDLRFKTIEDADAELEAFFNSETAQK